jgi:hypothetical protein
LPAGDYQVRLQLLGRTGPLPLNSENTIENGQTLILGGFSTSQPAQFSFPEQLVSMETEGQMELNLALWQPDGPVAADERPAYRYPGTITIINSVPEAGLKLYLVDPEGQRWPATQSQPPVYNFVIGPRWTSGLYRLEGTLQAADGKITGQLLSEPLLAVENWWPRQFEPPKIETPLVANFANQLQLLGYKLSDNRVKAGEALPITLYWQALPDMSPQANFIQFNHLMDSDGNLSGGYDRRPLEHYSTLLPAKWL